MPPQSPWASRANPAGDSPIVAASSFVDPTAILIGNVQVSGGTFIGPAAIIRADEADEHGLVQPVLIGEECNVQDGVIVHALKGTRVVIRGRSSISHGAVVHGPAEIGEGCFVGFRAVVFNARLGDGVFVGTGAVVQGVAVAPNTRIPPGGVIVTQAQADVLDRTGPEEQAFMRAVVAANLRLAAGYRTEWVGTG